MPLLDLGTLFDMSDIDNVTALTEAWKIASTKIKDIKTEIETKTSDSAAESVLMDLKEKLSAALTDESATKTSLLEELLQNRKSHDATSIDHPNSEIEVLSESRPSSSKHEDVFTPRPKEETPLTARFTAPKEYKHGENFTTWCSRFRRYLRASRIRRDDAFELLLNNVDDRTLEKLEPVADKLTPEQGRDPDLFMPIFEQAIYPKSDIRALRQQLTNGNLVQEDQEDVDTFASRVRSLAKRAYNIPSDRHEPCLNAFLNGMRDETLFDKVISVPGAEDDFDLAVESARKFEKMRRTNRDRPIDLDVLQINNSNSNNNDEEPAERNLNTRSDRPVQDHRNNSRQYRNGYNNNNRHQNRGRPTPGYGRRETRTCFICQIQGHIAANCSQNRLNPNRAGDSPSTGPEQ